jgi:hypothetical protein
MVSRMVRDCVMLVTEVMERRLGSRGVRGLDEEGGKTRELVFIRAVVVP